MDEDEANERALVAMRDASAKFAMSMKRMSSAFACLGMEVDEMARELRERLGEASASMSVAQRAIKTARQPRSG